MATTITQFRRDNPGCYIGGSETGKWIVVWCPYGGTNAGRAQRFDSYFDAQAASAEDCGRSCRGAKTHSIVELAVGSAPKFQPSRSWRKMVAAE
jgi:hypothetical protein